MLSIISSGNRGWCSSAVLIHEPPLVLSNNFYSSITKAWVVAWSNRLLPMMWRLRFESQLGVCCTFCELDQTCLQLVKKVSNSFLPHGGNLGPIQRDEQIFAWAMAGPSSRLNDSDILDYLDTIDSDSDFVNESDSNITSDENYMDDEDYREILSPEQPLPLHFPFQELTRPKHMSPPDSLPIFSYVPSARKKSQKNPVPLSSFATARGQEVPAKRPEAKRMTKLEIITTYNKFMCGIDTSDMKLYTYLDERRTVRYWNKIDFNIIARMVYKENYQGPGKLKTRYRYTVSIIEGLGEEWLSVKNNMVSRETRGPRVVNFEAYSFLEKPPPVHPTEIQTSAVELNMLANYATEAGKISLMASLVLTDSSQLTSDGFEKLPEQIMYPYAEPYDLQNHVIDHIRTCVLDTTSNDGDLKCFTIQQIVLAVIPCFLKIGTCTSCVTVIVREDYRPEECYNALVVNIDNRSGTKRAKIGSYAYKHPNVGVKYAVINVDVSDNVPIQPVTSINIREKEIEDTFQRMPSDSQLAEKANAQQEQLNKLNEVIDQIKKEKDCPTEVFLNKTIPGRNVAVVILPCPFRFGRLRHSCPAQFADIVPGLATTGARRMGTPTALARLFVCGYVFFMTLVAWHPGSRPPLSPLGVALRIARAVSRTRTSRRQNADPWSPDAASTASPKAAVSRITCVSQNRTAATIRTRTQYGSWSSARLRDFQPRGLRVRSSGSTAPYARGDNDTSTFINITIINCFQPVVGFRKHTTKS
uniref:Uncharacterized protein n=1 Tax=Timema poppense TaxID=170557 RepID=A0A7R9CV02_TIMPO|nr:unnamed protein product [Timema poppensis]